MSHFAKIEPTANATIFKVTNVIVAEQSFIDSGLAGDPATWVQTSYNTYGNVHYTPDPQGNLARTPDGGVALRANHAGIGYTYDKTHDVFYSPKRFASWNLNQNTWLWEPPTPEPAGKNHYWDEPTLSWKPVPVPPAVE